MDLSEIKVIKCSLFSDQMVTLTLSAQYWLNCNISKEQYNSVENFAGFKMALLLLSSLEDFC